MNRNFVKTIQRAVSITMTLIMSFGFLGFPGASIAHAAVGAVWYVQSGGLTSGTCESWANACELQYALGSAAATDEIWVAAGTYYPTDGTDRTVSFSLVNGVGVYGGFNGTESTLIERDPVTNVTILSGDIGVTDDISDNSYHVVTGGGTDNSAILDGFTV
jgi:hypothetical protein